MKSTITKEKLKKYFDLTSKALEIAKKSIIKGKENYARLSQARSGSSKSQAKEIIEMVENYLSDAKYFESKEDYVNAFACLNYAHGWLDSGVRLNIFDVKDDKLFTVK